jgi:hypothetical protein
MMISSKEFNVTSSPAKMMRFIHPIVSNGSGKIEIIYTAKIILDRFKRLRLYYNKDLFNVNCDEVYGYQLYRNHLT